MTKRKTAADLDGDLEKNSKPHSIRFLVHAVDGVIPYLTPESLRKCFPPTSSDRLLVGLAVRDTSVVPVYSQGKSRPRGYTFSSSAHADAWLEKYDRVTVPSFDLLDDEQDKKDSSFIVSDRNVMMWTPNGRLALSPQLMLEASQGLASQITLPLYDMIPPPDSDTKRTSRTRAAITRTREWFQHWTANYQDSIAGAWVPLLVDPIDGVDFEYQLEFVRSAARDGRVQGVVLIGWTHIRDEAIARQALLSVRETLQGLPLDVVVLTTRSLRQLLLAATHGASVVGSDLAAKLATLHKALMVDLSGWRAKESDGSDKGPKRFRRADERPGLDENGCIDLTPPGNDPKDHAWFSDSSPMVEGCSCYSCRTHSRSYIYHLVCAKELLANMLLMIHNLHHTLELLKAVEEATANDRAESIYENLCAQLGKSQT